MMNRNTTTALFFALMLSASSCRAQSFKTMIATDAALTTADIVTSRMIQAEPGGYEQNPLMPRHPSAALMASEIAGANILWDLAARKMVRLGHRRIGKAMLWAGLRDETYCVTHNTVKLQQNTAAVAGAAQATTQLRMGLSRH